MLSSPTLFSQLQNPNLHLIPHSFFHGISLKLPLKSQSMSFAASATTPKPLTVFIATKKVVTSPTTVNVHITGLTPGPHGMSMVIRQNGWISTGPDFNPKQLTHGAPEDEVCHAGDLGNIVANTDGNFIF
ncbi:hypothetical protein DVH24_005824 [Malus domestica]|uniref:Superoxide dismutase copper/zinc binding domain-containing protein n=1 Tax=Malus domestica TaxID=3750 RepID=A0A498IQ34_MALDO|nr:hypothetical protein DVH24_005824 [Malus domestica]